jgi:hypothetical protein
LPEFDRLGVLLLLGPGVGPVDDREGGACHAEGGGPSEEPSTACAAEVIDRGGFERPKVDQSAPILASKGRAKGVEDEEPMPTSVFERGVMGREVGLDSVMAIRTGSDRGAAAAAAAAEEEEEDSAPIEGEARIDTTGCCCCCCRGGAGGWWRGICGPTECRRRARGGERPPPPGVGREEGSERRASSVEEGRMCRFRREADGIEIGLDAEVEEERRIGGGDDVVRGGGEEAVVRS